MGTINVELEDTKKIEHELKKEQRNLTKRRFFGNKLAVTGTLIIFFAVLVSIFAPFIAVHDPYEVNPLNRLMPPSAEHFFGTDNFGRDLFSRVVYGTQVSMIVGFSVAVISSLIGTAIGLYASYYRFLDHLFMRISDGLMAFPAILLAISIMAAMGPSTKNVIIALSIVFIPLIARIVRSAGLVVKEQTYIEALRSLGASSTRIVWRHMLPNVLSPLIVQASFVFAISIITEAMLSFLGAGVPAPDPSIGNILYDGKNVIMTAWWMTLFPGGAIILIVLGLNLFGDGLRDLLDPHTNQAKK